MARLLSDGTDVAFVIIVTCCGRKTVSQEYYVIAAAAGLIRRRCGGGYGNRGGRCGDVTAVVARTVTGLSTPLYVIIMVVAATMASMDDHERKIVVEFCQLLEQSKQLFNGLR